MQFPTLDKFPKRVLAGIDIQDAFIISRLVIAAERLQIFRTTSISRDIAPYWTWLAAPE